MYLFLMTLFFYLMSTINNLNAMHDMQKIWHHTKSEEEQKDDERKQWLQERAIPWTLENSTGNESLDDPALLVEFFQKFKNDSTPDAQYKKRELLRNIIYVFWDDKWHKVRRKLIAAVVEVNTDTNNSDNFIQNDALHKALITDDLALARLLLNHQANPNSLNLCHEPVLFDVKSEAAARLLIEDYHVNPETRKAPFNFTVLHNILYKLPLPDLNLLTYYVQLGLATKQDRDGNTPLHVLCSIDDHNDSRAGDQMISIANVFLTAGVSVIEPNNKRQTPTSIAKEWIRDDYTISRTRQSLYRLLKDRKEQLKRQELETLQELPYFDQNLEEDASDE